MKCRPSGGGSGGALIRRYVSLREPHLRLCTFASPRRVPAGHGDRWAWKPPGTNPDREKFRVMRWGCSAYLKYAAPRGGAEEKNTQWEYTMPSTSRMRILADAVENDLTADEEVFNRRLRRFAQITQKGTVGCDPSGVV